MTKDTRPKIGFEAETEFSTDYEKKKHELKFIQIQLDMAHAFRAIKDIPLDMYIESLDKALTFAPFLDPTLFIKAQDDGNRWLRIAKIFQECRDKINKEFGK